MDVDQVEVNPQLSIEDKMLTTGVRPGFRTDREIKNAIQSAFFYDPRLSYFNPYVIVDKGVVTLKGSVISLNAKKAAALLDA